MPKNKFQGLVYSFLTVFITVHAFVWYCLSLEMGGMSVNVIKAGYSTNVWIYPISLVFLEIIIALLCVEFVGGPIARKWAFSKLDMKKASPIEIRTTIINCTVSVMCPIMSFIAVILYNVMSCTIHSFGEFVCVYLQTLVFNFPFAWFTQMFFIQPFVGKVFGIIFKVKQN